MTAVIYARYSSSGQREESIEGQISKEKIEHPLLEEDYVKFWLYRFRKMDSALLKNRL